MSERTLQFYWAGGLPPGMTKPQRLEAKRAFGVMGQHAGLPHEVTQIRPNRPDVYNDGTLIDTGDEWLIESWLTPDENSRDYIIQFLADALEINYSAMDALLDIVWFADANACRLWLAENWDKSP